MLASRKRSRLIRIFQQLWKTPRRRVVVSALAVILVGILSAYGDIIWEWIALYLWQAAIYPFVKITVEFFISKPYLATLIASLVIVIILLRQAINKTAPPKNIEVSPAANFRETLGGIEIYNGTENNLVALNAELMRINGERELVDPNNSPFRLPQEIYYWYYHNEPLTPSSGRRRIDSQKPATLAIVQYLEKFDVNQYAIKPHYDVNDGDILVIQFGCEIEVTREPITMVIQARVEIDKNNRASIVEVGTSAITEKLH